MSRSHPWLLVLAAVAAIAINCWGSMVVSEASEPHIVVIYADDLGYGDVQCYNPERGKIPMPHIDALAVEGMRFTDAHSSSGVCKTRSESVPRRPSTSSVRSGRPQHPRPPASQRRDRPHLPQAAVRFAAAKPHRPLSRSTA